ncbi:hypothetical protein [Agarivorans aestuarii]|uniref:hypothetical protein n=1 Tax=Agarivorans aestuarii TaxID=1563703 RepID=UPI001C7FC650|nr:hypothetical protein [Agarivorans aestuarii]
MGDNQDEPINDPMGIALLLTNLEHEFCELIDDQTSSERKAAVLLNVLHLRIITRILESFTETTTALAAFEFEGAEDHAQSSTPPAANGLETETARELHEFIETVNMFNARLNVVKAHVWKARSDIIFTSLAILLMWRHRNYEKLLETLKAVSLFVIDAELGGAAALLQQIKDMWESERTRKHKENVRNKIWIEKRGEFNHCCIEWLFSAAFFIELMKSHIQGAHADSETLSSRAAEQIEQFHTAEWQIIKETLEARPNV